MYGVVLWSNSEKKAAVIWCEDHGDLAFYVRPEDVENVELDAGDLVSFDMTVERHLRYAHNPRLVSDGMFAGIDDSLSGAAPQASPMRQPQVRGSAEIIALDQVRARQKAAREIPQDLAAHF